MGDEKKPDCVKVATRLRPLSKKELGNNESSIVEIEESTEDDPGQVTINDPDEKEPPAKFAFDIVFDTNCTQEHVYKTVGQPALLSLMTGYNGTIFAYGQTGSGKSWSMMGGGGELRGIIPRFNEEIFNQIAERVAEVPSRKYLITCSFFEIYNEVIQDLLNPCLDKGKIGAGLQVKEHPVLGIYVKDLMEMVVDSAEKLTGMMETGTSNRAVSATQMNSVSSRSHSIFIVKMHQKDEQDKSKNVFAKVNLVDLAGSERQKGTGATGQTLKEGANINKSLSALGNVINALVESANGKKVFVPFRNSKLTRVLQESLGGNSLTTMLAALSPAACNFEETLGTLRYANRAKAIKISATKNEEASQISRLNAEIEELKKKLSSSGGGGGGGGGSGVEADQEKAAIRQKYETQLQEMQSMAQTSWEEKAKLSKENEKQLSKAIEEHKRQAKAMQEECQRRLALMNAQKDLEFSVHGLLDSSKSLPVSKTVGSTSPHAPLRSGELPEQWLKTLASISEVTGQLKQQHTMALVFHGAFREDLRLWVDGETEQIHATARAGARRALTKIETLRRECENLRRLELQASDRMRELAAAITETNRQWKEGSMAALLAELKEEEKGQETDDNDKTGSAESEIQPLWMMTVEYMGSILQLIEEQSSVKIEELNAFAAIEIGTAAELVLSGVDFVEGANFTAEDTNILVSLAGEEEASADFARQASKASTVTAGPKPREQRPLQEWTVEDVDDGVDSTEFALKQLIDLEGLNKKKTPQELLSRPPPKFVHDVALLIAHDTGFLGNLSEEWPEPREGKIDILQNISDTVATAMCIGRIDFDPTDVLKGKEVPKTLKLLQLLAVAASKFKFGGVAPAGPADNGSKVKSKRRKPPAELSSKNASDMLPVLECLARCMTRVQEVQAARGDTRQDSGRASPARELERALKEKQEKYEEEVLIRKRHEERVSKLGEEAAQERLRLQECVAELDRRRKAAADTEVRIAELRSQVDTLRAGLLNRAHEFTHPEVVNMRAELDSVREESRVQAELKAKLAAEVKRLQHQKLEADKNRETMELEGQRMRQLLEERARIMSQNEDLQLLQAAKQQLEVKIQSCEEKLKAIGEADDIEREKEPTLIEARKQEALNNEDAQMQLQVIIEERDGLREGMDMLWQEQQRVTEELDNVSNGYTNLSDRLSLKIEEYQEQEEQLQQYDNLLRMLQENAEKNRHSPPTTAAVKPVKSPSPPPPPPPPPAPVENGPAADTEDADSSHYSDDDFEDPDDD